MHTIVENRATAFVTPSATPSDAPVATPRFDLYGPIHKALRSYMSHVLLRIGRLDTTDELDIEAGCTEVEGLIGVMRSHLTHENEFLHTALEARRPGAAARTAADHVEHEEALEGLRTDVQALRCACPESAARAAQRLYRHLALFTAENLEHMHVEETVITQELWSTYSDDELHAIHAALVGSLTPAEREWTLRWMVPALSPAERAGMLAGMRAEMPAPAFDAVLSMLRPLLDTPAWNKLCRALGLAQAPGLVDCR